MSLMMFTLTELSFNDFKAEKDVFDRKSCAIGMFILGVWL
jgi:hypothetical protein